MAEFFGLDTSNYTTSAAVFDSSSGKIRQKKMLLPVKKGQGGLRQSEALFHHVNRLTEVAGDLVSGLSDLRAVGVSAFPRNISGSYMPCFLAGKTAAELIAKTAGSELYYTSHQAGHIAAALYSCGRLDLIHKPFIAFHFSGGTSDCLYCAPNDEDVIGITPFSSSLDLKAGQAVDRVGLMLGLDFPCGRELEALAVKSDRKFKVRPSMKGRDCSFSGLENKCGDMLGRGEPYEDIAKFCLVYVGETVKAMADAALSELGELPLVFAGGVMSDKLIKDMILSRFSAFFAEPEFSCDNAAGVAVIAFEKHENNFRVQK